jgi:hypothetical protein
MTICAREEAERANEAGAPVWETLGYQIQPSWALPKLLWLFRDLGDIARDARLAQPRVWPEHSARTRTLDKPWGGEYDVVPVCQTLSGISDALAVCTARPVADRRYRIGTRRERQST